MSRGAAGGNGADIDAESSQVITVVAFKPDVCSVVRTVWPGAPEIMPATGLVDQHNLVTGLEHGKPQYLQWLDPSCFTCGGMADAHYIDCTYCLTDEEYCDKTKELCPSLTGEYTPQSP